MDARADDSGVTTRMPGSSMKVRCANDSARVMAEGEQEITSGLAGADVNLR